MTFGGLAGSLTGSLNRQRAGQIAGFAAVAIAAAALAGAWAGLPFLASWGTGLPAMKPLGALCLAALGLALVYPGREQRLAVAIGTSVAVLAAFLLSATFLNLDGTVDRLALRTPIHVPRLDGVRLHVLTFRIVHASTVAFGFAGLALALSRFNRRRLGATALAALAGVIVAFALLSYLTGISSLYRAASVAAPPLPTAAGLLCTAFGIIMRIGAMPALRKPRPLWHHLSALGCAILLPLLLFGAYAEVSIGDAELDEDGRELMNGARALSADIDRQVLGEIERLRALAASPSLQHGDFATFQRQAEASLPLRSGNIMLVDRNMRQFVNTWMAYGSPTEAAAIPEPVERAFATDKPQFTDLFIGQRAQEVMFAIVLPVEIDGERRYALVRSVDQRALAAPVAAENLPPGWRAAIANASGHVLAQTGFAAASPQAGESLEHNKQTSKEASHESTQEGGDTGMSPPPVQPREGVLEFFDARGRELEGYVHSDVTGWEAVTWEPRAQLEAPIRALWSTLGWLALVSVGMVIALALWLGRIIARSVRLAAREAAKLGDGAAEPAAETPIAEVNTLMADLREAAAKRQEADERLRDSERQLRLVTDNVPVAIARFDEEGRLTFANRGFMERNRLSLPQILGRRVVEVIGDKAYAAIERRLAECYAGNEVEFAFETRDQDGEPLFLQGRFVPEWQDGKVVGLLGATSDITRLKQAEQRLRASEVTFRQLVDNSPFGIYVVDAESRIVQASAGTRKTFDAGARPLIGRYFAEVMRSRWPEPYATEVIGRFRHTLDTGEPYNAPPMTERRKDTGEVESYDWQIERLTMPDGRFGVVCHYYDLSERQRYEAALRESEATFRAMFDSSAVGKIEIALETGRFLHANAAMCRLVGYSEAELLRRTVFDITHPDERDGDRESLRRMDGGSLPVFDREKRYIRKDGQIVWARVTANTIRDEAGRALRNTAVIQDIIERRRAEQDLEASRTRLQLALDAALLGWFQYDPARRSGWGDARFREICDIDVAMEEIPVDVLMERVRPDDREKMRASLAEHLDTANPKPAVAEFRIRRHDGGVRWVELHGLAFFEGAGRERRAVSLIGTVQDITERKQHEEQTQLLMREVNHRAKNMLSVVDAIAHQTATRSPEHFLARFSERIQALSANQDLLVRNEWHGVGIADLVRAQMAHFADLIGSRIVVHGPALRLQAASAQAIGLALHELATNAGKYGALSTDAGGVRIRWWTEDDAFHMSWTESGGPPVSAPSRRGFGTIVMEVMVERTVGGKVDLDYAPSGVRWRLTCPAGSALERPEHQSSGANRISA